MIDKMNESIYLRVRLSTFQSTASLRLCTTPKSGLCKQVDLHARLSSLEFDSVNDSKQISTPVCSVFTAYLIPVT
jgi:hypothetical protein